MSGFWNSLEDLLSLGIQARFLRRTERTIGELAEEVMRLKGEASVTTLSRELLDEYASLDTPAKKDFFHRLLSDFGPLPQALVRAIEAYQANPEPQTEQALERASEPRRLALIRLLNTAPGGTAALIRMREDLLSFSGETPALTLIDNDFGHLFASWFNRGFLQLRRIDWTTPANVLEKIIAYEAVHEVRGWTDLRRRLENDRRCFAFFHPALPDEPLIFVEVALTQGLASSVQTLLEADVSEAKDADTAIFFSISNCQRGLKNVMFGNFLIKQVVEELRKELPHLKRFATLSPIPGFVAWLRERHPDTANALTDAANAGDATPLEPRRDNLMRGCAHYLINEKSASYPRDPVARFHLRNGAVLERLNWEADVSEAGLRQSAGMMVNYLYDERRLARNHEAFMASGAVRAAGPVAALARQWENDVTRGAASRSNATEA